MSDRRLVIKTIMTGDSEHGDSYIEGAHIHKVTILQGDDDYQYHQSVTVQPSLENPNVLDINSKTIQGKSEYRLRNEPQICISFHFEDSPDVERNLVISHHKGNVYFDLK